MGCVEFSHEKKTTGEGLNSWRDELQEQQLSGMPVPDIFGLTCPVQFSSVAQSCPTLCDPMNRSMPGLPVYHQLLEITQTHVHRVSDAIQPSHPLSSPSPPAPNPSQHQGLFQSGPITSWQIDGETVETVADFNFWAPKSLQMVITAMKLNYSLEGKL